MFISLFWVAYFAALTPSVGTDGLPNGVLRLLFLVAFFNFMFLFSCEAVLGVAYHLLLHWLQWIPCVTRPHARPHARSRLVLRVLPSSELPARLASCYQCWHAAPRRACIHNEAPQCPICMEGDKIDRPWLALRACGHIFHESCIMSWVALQTHDARGAAVLNPETAALCPVGRCQATSIGGSAGGSGGGDLPVATPVL
jgi:hypothetical protein